MTAVRIELLIIWRTGGKGNALFRSGRDAALWRDLFSAKGAIHKKPGAKPQDFHEMMSVALNARFIQKAGVCWRGNRHGESRFQRWFTSRRESWGDAPGLREGAPLALSINWQRLVLITRARSSFLDGAARRL